MAIWAIQGDEHLRNTQLSSRLTDYNEALFKKLEFEYKYCVDHGIPELIKLGDTNTTLNTDLKSVLMNRYAILAKKYEKVHKCTILGNHDMYECNQDNLYKTSMYSLALMGAFDLLISPTRFPEIQVQVLNVQLEKSVQILKNMQEADVPTVIFGHHLFEWGLNPDSCLNRKHFEKFATWKKPVIVFLGDDHTQYAPLCLPNVTIHRLGSIMRTEKPTSNEPWQPRFALFNTETLNTEYVSIPCESYEIAFGTPTVKMKFDKLSDFAADADVTDPNVARLSDMSKLSKSFEKIGTTDYSKLRPSVVLQELNCPPRSFEYLRNLHTALGENF